MTGTVRAWIGAALLIPALGSAGAGDAVTLEGGFVWVRSDGDHTGDLKAVFTPTGEDRWNVDFHFDWEDGPHVYSGTARGDLSSGEFGGEVTNDNEERNMNFTFRGSFDQGKFLGTHASIQKDGTRRDTGTLSLRPLD